MKLILTANKWNQLDDGKFTMRSKGDVIEVSDETGAWLLKCKSAKHIEESEEIDSDDAPDPDGDSETSDSDTDGNPDEAATSDDAPERPAGAANRAAWDSYARALRKDPSVYKTKEDLMADLP